MKFFENVYGVKIKYILTFYMTDEIGNFPDYMMFIAQLWRYRDVYNKKICASRARFIMKNWYTYAFLSVGVAYMW